MTRHYIKPEDQLTHYLTARLTEEQLNVVEGLAKKDGCTRAQVMRNALDYYLAKRKLAEEIAQGLYPTVPATDRTYTEDNDNA